MTTREFLDTLCAALVREAGTLTLEDTPSTVEEWDSIGHLSMLSATESNLGVSINDEDIREFRSVGQLVSALKLRGVLED